MQEKVDVALAEDIYTLGIDFIEKENGLSVMEKGFEGMEMGSFVYGSYANALE